MIQLSQKAAQGLVEVFTQVTALGPQAQVALPIDHETTFILGVSPQGQMVITPIKTAVLLVEAPPVEAEPSEDKIVALNTGQSLAQLPAPAGEDAPSL